MSELLVVDQGAGATSEPSSRAAKGRFATNSAVVVPGVVLVLLLFAFFIWPLLFPVPDPVRGDILEANLAPFSPGHILGTDTTGNDELARVLYGGRNSLEIAFGVQVVGVLVGGFLGILSGYLGRIYDLVIMRVMDVLLAFPAIILAITVVEGLGATKPNLILAISFFAVPGFARLARADTLRIREQPFFVAARIAGARPRRMMIRHVVPHVWPQLVTFSCLGASIVVIVAGALSFLGYGIPAPAPSWGGMIASGQKAMSAAPALVYIPSIFLVVTATALNMLGEGLRRRWAVR